MSSRIPYNKREKAKVSDLVGKTINHIKADDYEINITTTDGCKYLMYHDQDCCESVSIEDIVGDLQDLVGSPLLRAEESTNHENPKDEGDAKWGSFTWTFYKFATIKGYVDIRWYGSSNGYYSESVDFIRIKD